MAKVTAPLQSIAAHGTLGNTLQFRRGRNGPIVVALPRHAKQVPAALTANAAMVTYLRKLIKAYYVANELMYITRAMANGTTKEVEYLREQLGTFQRWKGIGYGDPPVYTPAVAAAPTIEETPIPGAQRTSVTLTVAEDADYFMFHLLAAPTAQPSHHNTLLVLSPWMEAAIMPIPDTWPRPFDIQVSAWLFGCQLSSTSNRVTIV